MVVIQEIDSEPSSSEVVVTLNTGKKHKISSEQAHKLYGQLVDRHPAFRMSVRSASFSEVFAKKIMYLEKNMWQLSTLGGAYAAMSSYASEFGKRLMEVSKTQYLISTRLNSELYRSRSRIYIANALASNGYLKMATKVIDNEVKYVRDTLRDGFTLKMAVATQINIENKKKRLRQPQLTDGT